MPTPIMLKPEQAPSDATSGTHIESVHCDDYSTTMPDKPRIVQVPREIHSDLNDRSESLPTTAPPTTKHVKSSKTSKKHKKTKKRQKSSENLRRSSIQEEFPAYLELEHFMDTLEDCNAFSVQMDGSVVRSGSSSTTSTKASRGEKMTIVSKTDEGLPQKTNDLEMGIVPEKLVDDISDILTADEPTGSTTQKTSYWQSLAKRQVLYVLLCLIMVAAAVIVPILLIQDDNTSDGVERLAWYEDSHVVGPLPIDLCHDGYGNIGGNYSCSNSAEPGKLCDIVANAIINVTGSEMALLNVGVCKGSIDGPQMTVGDIRAALETQQLVLVEISGRSLLQALEQAMTKTFGLGLHANNELAYPYAAGLRYDVEANLDDGRRIAKVEVNVEHLGLWRPLNPRRFYKVVTTRDVADGGQGYRAFSQVNEHWITPFPFTVGDALLDYAIKHQSTWWDLDADSYSTHSFVGPEVDPTIATVPESICLEWASDPQSKSNICSQSDTLRRRGGGSCGLVAWSLLDQYLLADMALIQASLCASDLPSGNFVDSQVDTLVPQDQDLIMVIMNGTSIVQVLNSALEYAIEHSMPDAYPYSAALRYTVNTTATGSTNRISSVETMTAGKRWIPLVESDLYSVLITRDLAIGHESGYQELGHVTVRETGLGTRQAIMDYASEWKILYVPPIEMYSIQGYIS